MELRRWEPMRPLLRPLFSNGSNGVDAANIASPRLRLHTKHRLPADTPVAQLVGDPCNVAPVPLRPDLRRQRLFLDQRHQQCKIRRKLLLRPRTEREETLQARILPAAE